MRRRTAATVLAALTLVATAACGSDSEGGSDTGGTSSASSSIDGLTVTGKFAQEPKVEVDGLDVDELEKTTPVTGDGAEVTEDTALNYRFLIANGTSGETAASNYAENTARRMTVSEEAPIIKEAVIGSTIGSRLVLAMPVSDLLGEEGAPSAGLEPDQDLVMVIDLIDEAAKPLDGPEGAEVDPPADAPTVVEEDGTVTGIDFSDAPADPPAGLQVIPLVEGEGAKVKVGDNITVNYHGAVWGADEAFDSSFERGEPASFQLVDGGLIAGWVQGLEGVKVGSRVMLVIPPKLGYGEAGSGEKIPGGSTLVFVIDVLGANL